MASDTVYAVFGTKARVLTALIDARLAPGGAANVMDRPEALAVRDETDQRRQLGLLARDLAAVSARVRPVFEILRTAAAVEPDMAGVFAEMNGYRLLNLRRTIGWMARAQGPLRLEEDQAVLTLWALASPDVGRMLCDGQGWSQEQYAAWLEDVLIRTLLPDPPAGTRRRRD